jgi:hypothetical protein
VMHTGTPSGCQGTAADVGAPCGMRPLGLPAGLEKAAQTPTPARQRSARPNGTGWVCAVVVGSPVLRGTHRTAWNLPYDAMNSVVQV